MRPASGRYLADRAAIKAGEQASRVHPDTTRTQEFSECHCNLLLHYACQASFCSGEIAIVAVRAQHRMVKIIALSCTKRSESA